MNIKQFLKPEWRKIVIFFVLFFFMALLALYMSWPGPFVSCEEGYERYDENIILLMLSSVKCMPSNSIIFYEARDFILNLFAIFILPYLIACSIVWICNKFRKVKKK